MKLIFSFKEGMVLDSYSSLEVGEAATTAWIFCENGIKWYFMKPFSADLHVFYIFISLFFFCHQANGGFVIEEFFLIYKDYACT